MFFQRGPAGRHRTEHTTKKSLVATPQLGRSARDGRCRRGCVYMIGVRCGDVSKLWIPNSSSDGVLTSWNCVSRLVHAGAPPEPARGKQKNSEFILHCYICESHWCAVGAPLCRPICFCFSSFPGVRGVGFGKELKSENTSKKECCEGDSGCTLWLGREFW